MEECGTNQAPGGWCDEWNHHTNDGGFVASPRTPLDQGLHPLRGRMKEVQWFIRVKEHQIYRKPSRIFA
ncbi:hypothetical protein SSP35_42_00100 [Streptomyces sp. NBRC 110611]|nr:hypothetical protein SSP35_42_00100 [Streptomyces sp. NBRC 110611]